jgi:hypothetical protein
MSADIAMTIVVGNLTGDPELRFTASGAAVASFTIASTLRSFDRASNEWKDGETLFLRCSIWRQAAEHVGESLLMRSSDRGLLVFQGLECRGHVQDCRSVGDHRACLAQPVSVSDTGSDRRKLGCRDEEESSRRASCVGSTDNSSERCTWFFDRSGRCSCPIHLGCARVA